MPSDRIAPTFTDAPTRAAHEYGHGSARFALVDARARGDAVRLFAVVRAVADRHLGTLLRALNQLRLTEATMVVLVADHGEHLGEHGAYDHSGTHEEVLHVPDDDCTAREFGGAASRADLIDLMPSVLDALKIELPEGVQGRGLLTKAGAPEERVVLAEWRHFSIVGKGQGRTGDFQLMLRTAHEKFVLDLLDPKGGSRYFDLESDPAELDNLFAKRPSTLPHLEQVLAHHREHDVDGELLRPTRLELGAEDIEILRALGYAE